ncbi:MAG: asparagine synthase-related protein, partial [Gammaproteobacteria bacterium]|nr:asparagine synthase-related protein [Gammaproteobacteria bacterium]
MSSFIYWQNFNISDDDIQALKLAINDRQVGAETKLHSFNAGSGLLYPINQGFTLNNSKFVYSPEKLRYGNTLGEDAFRALNNDTAPDFSNIHSPFASLSRDESTNKTELAIDKVGICKLYYMVKENSLIVSNRLDLIASLTKPQISPQAIFNFIDSHVIPSPLTIYQNIFKLEPAEKIIFCEGTIDKLRYWTPIFTDENRASMAELESQGRDALENAVKNHTPNAQTGAFLSGGLDSSTVS